MRKSGVDRQHEAAVGGYQASHPTYHRSRSCRRCRRQCCRQIMGGVAGRRYCDSGSVLLNPARRFSVAW